jgi:hypothetical protein
MAYLGIVRVVVKWGVACGVDVRRVVGQMLAHISLGELTCR